MPPSKRIYTLVDFAKDLDWKPLHFVKPLPKNRRCSICRLVRKVTTILPCRHVACSCCYGHCEAEDGHACPIDGKSFPPKVKWRHFPTKNMLRRKVKCWNEAHGCNAVIAASKVTEHFHRDCQYHSALCTRCSSMVLCSDMCEHLKSSCDERGAREAAENVEKSGTVRGEFATGAPKALENMVRETMTLLKHSIMSNSALHGRMTEISRRINYLRDFMEKGKIPLLEITSTAKQLLSNTGGIDEELESLKGQCADEFDQVQEDIESVKTDARACTGVVYKKMQNALTAFARNVTRCEFVIQEMGSLEETAMRYGEGFYCDRLTNLRWYSLYPGVALQKRGGIVFLHLFLELVKGELDDVLHWPFSHFVKCTFLHHYTGEHHILIGKPTRDSESLQKPTGVFMNAFMFPECVPLEVLKSGGYVHDDELRVIWQLL